MKRLALTISLILVVVLALSFVYVNRVAATKAPPPSVQMLSTSFSGVGLPPAVLTTVATLSFSAAQPAKLEVTSENTAQFNPAQCDIALDGTILVATSLALLSPDLTVTDSSVAAGSHTLTVDCVNASTNPANNDSGSVSAIITTGL